MSLFSASLSLSLCSLSGFITHRGKRLSPSSLPLSSWWPGHCSAPHSFSWQERVSPPCSWWSWRPTCPWKSWTVPWPATHQGQSRTCPAQTWCVWWSSGSYVSVCSLLVLGHLWPLLRPMAMGWHGAMADALQWLPWEKLLFLLLYLLERIWTQNKQY